MATNIVEQYQVLPSSGTSIEQLLPLLHFDMLFLFFQAMKVVFFYELQCPKSHFLDTIVPNLKNSLSLALKHFPPFAGKIVFPLVSGMPISHYMAGDSISLIIAESTMDFNDLTQNQSRDADKFHNLVPKLPRVDHSPDSNSIRFPVCSIQVTFFPNQGVSFGFTVHHSIGDGTTLFHFLRTWASITKFNGDAHLIASAEECLPFFGRTDIVGRANELATTYWNLLKKNLSMSRLFINLPKGKLRRTFILTANEIKQLKDFILNHKTKKPNPGHGHGHSHLTSFTVVVGHVWVCLAKSADAAAGEKVEDSATEHFGCVVDCRSRLNPPLPKTYFGNCLEIIYAEANHGELKGEEGITVAAQAVGEAIHQALTNEKGILDESEKRILKVLSVLGKVGATFHSVAGSPRFNVYDDVEFGWGKMKKMEEVDTDWDGIISVGKWRDGDGVEIGISMLEPQMRAFANAFNQGLTQAMHNASCMHANV